MTEGNTQKHISTSKSPLSLTLHHRAFVITYLLQMQKEPHSYLMSGPKHICVFTSKNLQTPSGTRNNYSILNSWYTTDTQQHVCPCWRVRVHCESYLSNINFTNFMSIFLKNCKLHTVGFMVLKSSVSGDSDLLRRGAVSLGKWVPVLWKNTVHSSSKIKELLDSLTLEHSICWEELSKWYSVISHKTRIPSCIFF
jgi:hypothetical protein